MGHGNVQNVVDNVLKKVYELSQRVDKRVLIQVGPNLCIHTRMQAVFNLKFSDKSCQAVHELVMNHALAAEKMGPGAFDVFLEMLTKNTKSNHVLDPKDYPAVPGSCLSMVPSNDDVRWILDECLTDSRPIIKEMIDVALQMAGFAGRIVVEKGTSSPSVELIRGYSFSETPVWPLNIRLESPRIVCIDGMIESVSELHQFLEDVAEAKVPVLLFVRGLADEVSHTLRVNYDRGSLKVIPFIVKFDLEGLNTLNDISIAAGARLISHHDGNFISSVKLSDAAVIDEAVIYPTKVALTSPLTGKAVKAHVEFLKQKRAEQVDDVARLFDLRIRSLMANHVVLRLPDDREFVVASQAIDRALRAVRSLVEHGSIIVDDKRMLTTTYLAANVHAERCLATLRGLGSIVSPAA